MGALILEVKLTDIVPHTGVLLLYDLLVFIGDPVEHVIVVPREWQSFEIPPEADDERHHVLDQGRILQQLLQQWHHVESDWN